MAKFNVDSLFGVDVDFAYFNAIEIVAKLGLLKEVLGNKRVKGLMAQHGRKHRIVSIAARQVLLDYLKPVLDGKFMPFDEYYVDDALHTGRDQRYEAEEKFLFLMLSIARGKSVTGLKRLGERTSTREARAFYGKGLSLYKYLRQELNDHTRDYIQRYKERQSGVVPEQETQQAPADSNTTSTPTPRKSKPVVKKPTNNEPTPFAKEVATALALQAQASQLIAEQAQLATTGTPVDLDAFKTLCARLIDSYRRNPHALMCVRHIQNSDDYIAEHSFACAVLSCSLAHALKLDDRYVGAVTLGGLLFDIGRFRLPKPLTHKAGKLSDAEFSLMRKHLQFGESLLRYNQSMPKVVYQMIWDHHEREDGAGYPNGKVGSEISAYGKIGAIVDAYDAMTSEQTFKAPLTPTQAQEKLKAESGLAFDTNVLNAFLSHLGSVPVGSCVELSNGRLGFVLTLNARQQPSLVRQVYSLTNKSYIVATDVAIDKVAGTRIQQVVLPADYNLRFIDHIA
ncbi:HD-GYP domain-containing protein [Marinomonas ostreistagni]|uniref:HD-GYP domain-containing protein n=1 Tax=Marinomonas ostreistagni TaxID=359209 RepID=UPI00194E35C6|nr:HD domain-containing phosphohydrolase [Marinomonas ostreistagni]MBM6551141.1 HD domain-containing protein [Marinomonas ostreistagni]